MFKIFIGLSRVSEKCAGFSEECPEFSEDREILNRVQGVVRSICGFEECPRFSEE